MWKAGFSAEKRDSLFLELKMTEIQKKPNEQVRANMNEEFQIRQTREFDLVILSYEKLELGGEKDIKKKSSPHFLRSTLLKYDVMLGFITKR